jgi:hypothetical protein
MTIKSLLKNKKMLYIVLFFSVFNLFSYLMLKQLDAVAFFIIIGFLTSYFSKNMIIIMLTSVISTFILVQINMLGKVQEGMVGEKTDSDDKAEEGTEKIPLTKKDEPKVLGEAPPDAKPAEPINGTQRAALTTATPSKKDAFTQKLSPANYSAADDDDVPRHKPKIDYASTLESAYDNLDKMLGSDAIRNMTEDTGRLAEKQQILMGNIEKMTPIMEKAGSILNNFDMSAITKLMDKFGGTKEVQVPVSA